MSGSANILIVDDSHSTRFILKEMVDELGYTSILAENGVVALKHVQKQNIDMVLLDIIMPEMDGYEFLDRIKKDNDLRHLPVVMISSVDEIESIVRCVEKGADDYLNKPFNSTLLKARISSCLEKKRLRDAERELLESTLNGSIKVMTDILALVNPTAFSRTSRLKNYVRHIVDQCKLPDTWKFELAAMLSHIGCIILPPDLLDKMYVGQELTEDEQKLFASHPSIGKELLSKIPRLEVVSEMIANQQSELNIKEKAKDPRHREIENLGGQILKVAIAYDALTVHGMLHEKALEALRKQPLKYDSTLVLTLKNLMEFYVEMEVETIPVGKLFHGMALDEDFFVGEVLVVAKDIELTLPVLERLQRFAQNKGAMQSIRVRVPKGRVE